MESAEPTPNGNFAKTPGDYIDLMKRRRGLAFITGALVLAAAVTAAIVIPPVYRSTATILIEEPEVPTDLVQSTVTSYADQRIQMIKYRVLTSQNLTEIMNRFGLYEDSRQRRPMTEVIDNFREDIQVEPISANVLNPSGNATRATIAFTVSYDNQVPRLAQQVANELVTLYLSENAKERQGQAAAATKFLREESDRLSSRIRDLESQLADFKLKNGNTLPGQADGNRDVVLLTQRDIQEIDRRLDALKERRTYLESEISRAAARGPMSQQAVDATQERINTLQAEYARLQSTRGAKHPEVLRLQDEIAALQNPQTARNTAARNAAAAGTTLRTNTPAEAQYDQLSMQLRGQLNDVTSEAAALQNQRRSLTQTLTAVQQRVAQMPEVERAYLTLSRDYENAQRMYSETRNKQLAAELSEQLEMESKSERFSLIEPPVLPSEPEQPNRTLIVAFGAMLAFAAGIGIVLLVDLFDDRIHGARQLARVTGELPLVVVPYVYTPRERLSRVTQQFAYMTTLVAVLAVGAVTVHQRVMPLDVLWFKLVATGHDAVAAVR